MSKEKRLILLELNEINFDAVKCYLDRGLNIPGFSQLLSTNLNITKCETAYENLEPWIQWPSIHTGKTYSEHKVFRLGDIINYPKKQIFEIVESRGFKVGAISPMNASNKLNAPAYFIPDPWTQTPSDGSFFSRSLHTAISQAVNDNSKAKLTLKSKILLGLSLLLLVNPRKLFPLIGLAFSSRGKSWRKALFLDMFLFEVHQTFFKKKKPNFSTLFLNAGAHIQHHYFFNSLFNSHAKNKNPDWYLHSEQDPFKEMLLKYDQILVELLNQDDCSLIVATGMSQKLHDNVTFYYRLKEHGKFLNSLGINHEAVYPRMTRDFLVSFRTEDEAKNAELVLSKVYLHHDRVFGDIDNRGTDLFVTLTYNKEITPNCSLFIAGKEAHWLDHVTFVAIKNGEHQSKGFVYFSDDIVKLAPPRNSNITEINQSILNFF